MGVFEVELPDKRVIEVEAPDAERARSGGLVWQRDNPLEAAMPQMAQPTSPFSAPQGGAPALQPQPDLAQGAFPAPPQQAYNPWAEPPTKAQRDWGGYPWASEQPAKALLSDPALDLENRSTFTSAPGELVRQFGSSVLGGNVRNAGRALEGVGALVGSDSVEATGSGVADWGGSLETKPIVPGVEHIRTDTAANMLRDTTNYAAGMLGSGLGSVLPSALGGAATAAITKNPITGIIAGAALPSYIQNFGDTYGAVRDDVGIQTRIAQGKLTKRDAAGTVALAAIPMAMLDSTSLLAGVGPLFVKEAKDALKGRITKALVTGALVEGGTEGMQEIISQWAQDYLGSQTAMKEKILAVTNSAIGGVLVGGTLGGGSAALSRPKPPPTDQLKSAFDEVTGAAAPVTPGDVGLVGTNIAFPPAPHSPPDMGVPRPGVGAPGPLGPEPPPPTGPADYGAIGPIGPQTTVAPPQPGPAAAPGSPSPTAAVDMGETDMGYDVKVRKTPDGDWGVFVDAGDGPSTLLTRSTDLDFAKRAATNYLDTGDVNTPGEDTPPAVPTPSTTMDPKVVEYLSRNEPPLAAPLMQRRPQEPDIPEVSEIPIEQAVIRGPRLKTNVQKVWRSKDGWQIVQTGPLPTSSGNYTPPGLRFHVLDPEGRKKGSAFNANPDYGWSPESTLAAAQAQLALHSMDRDAWLDYVRRQREDARRNWEASQRNLAQGRPTAPLQGEILSPGTGPVAAMGPIEVGTGTEVTKFSTSAGSDAFARAMKIMGISMYGKPEQMPEIAVKELLQNSFDATKQELEKGTIAKGRIDFETDAAKNTIRIRDNGSGMTPKILEAAFFQPGGTHKEGKRPSGGFGFAKMVYMYGNKAVRVITMREGKVHVVASNGDEIFDWIAHKKTPPRVLTRNPTAADAKMFPEGHGTVVELVLPKDYIDAKGGVNNIQVSSTKESYTSLDRSPLFADIDVRWNGKLLQNVGSTFPLQDYRPLAIFKFPWGNVRLIQSKEKVDFPSSYTSNVHVLSNGVWQFSTALRYDMRAYNGPQVPHWFYLDIESKVKPEEPGYPFDTNRQGFSESEKKDFGQIFLHLSKVYKYEQAKEGAESFGSFYYLKGAPVPGGYTRSPQQELKPEKPAGSLATIIPIGATVEIVDGQLQVKGQKLPVIDIYASDKGDPEQDIFTLRVKPGLIDPNAVMVHDNTVVTISALEKKSLSEMGHEKFGKQFDEFLHEVGGAFIDLRTAVVKQMNKAAPYSDQRAVLGNYDALLQEAIGISLDRENRGVSIRIPMSGSFINPAIPEFKDAVRAAVGVVGTMIHELAHHKARTGPNGHDERFPAEMQRIIIALETANPTEFNFHAFKQRLVSIYSKHYDVFTWLNDGFSGALDVQSRGKRFEVSGASQGRNGGALGAMAQARDGAGNQQSQIYARSEAGAAVDAAREGRRGIGYDVAVGGAVSEDAATARYNNALHRVDPDLHSAPAQLEVEKIYDGLWNAFQAAGGVGGRGGGTGAATPPGGIGAPPPPTGPATVPPNVTQSLAHATKITWLLKWAWGLGRLMDRNPNLTPGLRYEEWVKGSIVDASKIHDAAMRIAKEWRHLGRRAEPLAEMIDYLTNMNYRTPQEAANGVRRQPSLAEFNAAKAKFGLDAEGEQVLKRVNRFFKGFLQVTVDNAKATAMRTITDQTALAAKLMEIENRQRELSKTPYFPFVRFGRHFVVVKDAKGNTVYFDTYERRGLVSAEAMQTRGEAQLKAKYPNHTVEKGILPENVAPFVGMPPELMDAVAAELQLTKQQMDALDQLRYKYAPAASFVHHFQHKNYTPGYSHDFLRAFSRYAFHGGRYYARTKYAWRLRDEIKAVRGIGGNKATAIANYLEDHLNNVFLDSKGDYGKVKGAIFLWTFGFSPMAALVNLSQVPMITYPFLAAKFGGIGRGDLKASAAIAKAFADIRNFYRRGTYNIPISGRPANFVFDALDYGVRTRRLSEAMSSELAAVANADNLLGMGNSKVGRGFQSIMEKAVFMFEMAEQFNRRVTYRAALELALDNPNAKGVQEALNKHAEEYKALRQEKSYLTEAQAKAIISAVYATEQTQFMYAKEMRPRFIRGGLAGTVFVFKMYLLNVLQLLGANKSSVMPRFMIMMLLMAGLMGLPGAEEMEDIAEQLGKWMFGKDFKARLALRQFILDIANEKIPPDLVLHGLSRKSFGVPAMMDLMGENPGRGLGGRTQDAGTKAVYDQYVTRTRARGGEPISFEAFAKQHSQNIPIPQVDMSKSLGMGRLLPVDIGKIVDPGKDANKLIAEQAQRASGAVFSVGFNFVKAFADSTTPATDWKRWERTMPRAVASASRAYRAFDEGRERGRGGPAAAPTAVPYDIRDPEHVGEILLMASGFMNTRTSGFWDATMAQADLNGKYTFEKSILMQQMFEALSGKIPEEKDRVISKIKEFNTNLPQWAKGYAVTNDALEASMRERTTNRAHREMGLPRQRQGIPVAQHTQTLFPESVVDVRRVPPGVAP